MPGAKTVFTILGAGIGIYLLSKLSAGNKLQLYPKKITAVGKTLADFKLVYTMEAVNPSFTSLKLNNLYLNIYDRKTQLGKIVVDSPIIIPKNTTIDINLPIKLNTGAVVYFIYEVIMKQIRKINVVGNINSEGFTIPVSEIVDFNF